MNEVVLIANTVVSAVMMLAWNGKNGLNRIIKVAWLALFVANLLVFR